MADLPFMLVGSMPAGSSGCPWFRGNVCVGVHRGFGLSAASPLSSQLKLLFTAVTQSSSAHECNSDLCCAQLVLHVTPRARSVSTRVPVQTVRAIMCCIVALPSTAVLLHQYQHQHQLVPTYTYTTSASTSSPAHGAVPSEQRHLRCHLFSLSPSSLQIASPHIAASTCTRTPGSQHPEVPCPCPASGGL